MTFAELRVGDHFIWASVGNRPHSGSVNVNIKIARSEDGGGFAIDLATRKESVSPSVRDLNEPEEWIPGGAHVVKLNGRF